MAKNIFSAVKESARTYIENNTLAQNIMHNDLTKDFIPQVRKEYISYNVKCCSYTNLPAAGFPLTG